MNLGRYDISGMGWPDIARFVVGVDVVANLRLGVGGYGHLGEWSWVRGDGYGFILGGSVFLG